MRAATKGPLNLTRLCRPQAGKAEGAVWNRPSLCSYAEMDMTGEPIALRTRRTRD